MSSATSKPGTFEILASGHESEFPTIARAMQDARPASNIRVEWIVDTLKPNLDTYAPSLTREIWHNYQQIFRATTKSRPDLSVDAAAHDAAHKLLTSLENALIFGVPYRDVNALPFSTLGGYRHFLGRPLNDNDIIQLRPLREPFFRIVEIDYSAGGEVYLDYPIAEWIAETTLQVIPQAA